MADDSIAAVYVAWPTFKNAVENLAQGVPNQVDRSTFPGLSWGVQSQLLSGFKFLGLITADNRPTDALHALAVADEGARKDKLKAILQDKYADIFALDLTKATPNQLNEKMGSSYGVMGDTREKAIRFFLAAAQYTGVPVSRFLAKPAPGAAAATNGNRATRGRRTTRPRPSPASNPQSDQTPTAPPGTSRAVQLKSGGTLTLAATLDLFSLSADDRKFVFELIDKLEDYAKNNSDAQK